MLGTWSTGLGLFGDIRIKIAASCTKLDVVMLDLLKFVEIKFVWLNMCLIY